MALRELAERTGDGVLVLLLWDDEEPPGREVAVLYRDVRREIVHTIYPPRARALDAYYHPSAYTHRAHPHPAAA